MPDSFSDTSFYQMGPFTVAAGWLVPEARDALEELYSDFPRVSHQYADFYPRVQYPSLFRRWYRPQVDFYSDNHRPFQPLPANQATPMFEWGLNWCIANYAHQYLLLHAAGLEKNGRMVIMPAPPGSGKSTLTAALMLEGWRLLSDEIVMIKLDDGLAYPLARPINLKNNSISIIESRYPDHYVSPRCTDTQKGTVSLVKPTRESVANMHRPASPTHIIFPKYECGAALSTEQYPKGPTVLEFITNSFNYHLLGIEGFERVTEVVRRCQTMKLNYSRLEDAFAFFENLADMASEQSRVQGAR